MLKRMLISLLILPSLGHAGGAFDGIFFCNASGAGLTASNYVTVNGQPDGRAIFAVAAVQQVTPVYGYGIGEISGNKFTGSTNFGYPFSLLIDDTSIVGTVTIRWNGQPVPTSVSCVKVW
jgi:hypothetical protein